jgi:hypothetical protein
MQNRLASTVPTMYLSFFFYFITQIVPNTCNTVPNNLLLPVFISVDVDEVFEYSEVFRLTC